MCVRHTASFKNNYRRRPITKLFNTPQKKDNDSGTPVRVKQNLNKKLPGPDGPGSFQI